MVLEMIILLANLGLLYLLSLLVSPHGSRMAFSHNVVYFIVFNSLDMLYGLGPISFKYCNRWLY